jgi:mannose-6-phosphate isomerase
MIWGSESWEISCRPQETGIIKNGEYAGMSFDEFISMNPEAVLGKGIKSFPLLVKIIDAHDTLSVQVHPNDSYAEARGETGKSECWYILKPPTDGYLIIGLKQGVTREALAAAYENGTVEDCLNRLKVQRGDIVNIPAGLIHALTAGAVVAEIQQNSDVTYRLYDFGRKGADGKPRPLHVDDALAVTDFEEKFPKAVHNSDVLECEHFTVKKHVISEPVKFKSNPKAFSVYTCVEGEVVFETDEDSVSLFETNSVFICADTGEFTVRPISGNAIVLNSSPRHL